MIQSVRVALVAVIAWASVADAQSTAELATRELLVGCHVVLFHSALGLRPFVLQWAEQLRMAGHRVTTPDFYRGRTFSTYEEASAALESAGGIPRYLEWTVEFGKKVPPGSVFMGFSNGAGSAELLAATTPSTRAAVLMHRVLPLEQLGVSDWPAGVPVQVHFAENDPYRNPDAVAALERSVRAAGAGFEYFSYPGDGHLFADRDLPEFDAASAGRMAQRVFAFLKGVCSEEHDEP